MYEMNTKYRYLSILFIACKYLNFHDVDPYEITADKFKLKCISEMKADPIAETREVYDRIRLEFTENMSNVQSEAFTATINKSSRETIMRKMRLVKENAIGQMPKSQTETETWWVQNFLEDFIKI